MLAPRVEEGERTRTGLRVDIFLYGGKELVHWLFPLCAPLFCSVHCRGGGALKTGGG